MKADRRNIDIIKKELGKEYCVRFVLLAVMSVLMAGCATPYHADFSKPKSPDERTNPYQQQVPTDGVASVLRDIITRR